MKKARILVWTGTLLFATSICLENFTAAPKYLVYPLLPIGLLVMLIGLREARRFLQNRKPITGKTRNRIFALMLALFAIGAVGGVYLSSRSTPNLSLGKEVVIGVVTLLVGAAILYWRLYKRPIEDLDQFPKRWFVLFGIALLLFVFSAFLGVFDRGGDATRRVDGDVGKVIASWQKKSVSVDAFETLIHDLRAIHTRGAPPDVQIALSEYAKALDDGVAALKSGDNFRVFEPIIKEKKEALVDAIKKHK